MQPEGEITFAVQVCEGVSEKGFLPVFIEVGMEKDVDERTVDVHIKRLRERYKGNPNFDIITVRGLGYKAVKLV